LLTPGKSDWRGQDRGGKGKTPELAAPEEVVAPTLEFARFLGGELDANMHFIPQLPSEIGKSWAETSQV
jgi:hypothetical protein